MTVKIDSATIISSLETAIELSYEKMSHKLLGDLFGSFCLIWSSDYLEKFMHTSPINESEAQNYCLYATILSSEQ